MCKDLKFTRPSVHYLDQWYSQTTTLGRSNETKQSAFKGALRDRSAEVFKARFVRAAVPNRKCNMRSGAWSERFPGTASGHAL